MKRSDARTKGLRLAAKVATVGGVALAALGLAEARAASSAPSVTSVTTTSATSASDDTQPLPMEGMVQARGGNCGCAPCWGPPAPPARGTTGAA